jgi:regulator of protease activity HflC (stomatin/prohibitin superfamily)
MNIANLIQGLATVAWLATLGIIALAVVRASRGRPLKRASSMIIALVIVSVLATVVGAGIVFVAPTERGVVVSPYAFRAPDGYLKAPLSPGLHWIVPGEQTVLYTISRQTYTMSTSVGEGQVTGDDSIQARTKDGQVVFIDASVIYAIDPSKVIQLHIDWQERYQDEVVRPLARGIIRDMASQYGVEEIVSTQRTELEQKITDQLRLKMGENNLELVDFILRDLHFSDQYAAAIEQKQIAQQQALQAQFVVEQRKQEAEQARQVAQGQADAAVIAAKGAAQARILQAEAEAQALLDIEAALKNNPDLLTYQYITKLSPNVQVMLLPNSSPFILTLPDLAAQAK